MRAARRGGAVFVAGDAGLGMTAMLDAALGRYLEATIRTGTQIHIYRVADGRIVEHWAGRDDVGMFRQLGLRISA